MARRLPTILAEFLSARRLHGRGPDAAKLLGVRHTTFYGWLSGAHVPPRPAAERLAKKLRRPDLVGLIELDRLDHRKRLHRAQRQAAAVAP